MSNENTINCFIGGALGLMTVCSNKIVTIGKLSASLASNEINNKPLESFGCKSNWCVIGIDELTYKNLT